MARRRDAVDRLSCLRIGGHEVLEIGFPEHQQATIGQRRYVRLTRTARKQSHLAEEFSAAEPYRPRGQRYLDCS